MMLKTEVGSRVVGSCTCISCRKFEVMATASVETENKASQVLIKSHYEQATRFVKALFVKNIFVSSSVGWE